MDPQAYRALRASAYRVIVWGLLYILRGLNHYWNVQWTMKRPLHHWDHIDCYSLLYAVYILFLVKDGYTTMGVGRIFSRGGVSRGLSQNFFQGGPKVVKFGFYPSKLRKTSFFANNFKIQGGPNPSAPPFRRPCTTRNFNIHKCLHLWSRYAAIISLNFFIWFPGITKLLKSHAVSVPEIQNQQGRKFDETCCVLICLCKESKKQKY